MDDPLNLPAISNVPSLISTTRVSNTPPSTNVTYRLAIVGEAPGEQEEAYGEPFAGPSGNLLNSILSSVGVLRAACFVGNVCKYRPPNNDITEFGYDHPHVQNGWMELQDELRAYAPNCILALGNTPLHFLTGNTGITKWRGSILQSSFGKVVPALHPAAVLREYNDWPLLRFDAKRARDEAESPELCLPQRNLELDLSAREICDRLDNWPAGQLLSFDIEGGIDVFPCCSVAGHANHGFIIAWSRHSTEEQGRIAVSLSRCLYSSEIPKCLQNSLYDRFVLAYKYRMLIRNVVEDTMDKQWAIYPEMDKNLGVIGSIWTREPYYKFERKTDDQETFYRYCIKDSCVTLEACQAMDGALSPQERVHYNFNVALKSPLLYMELRGFRYNLDLARQRHAECMAALSECASRLMLRISPMQFTKAKNGFTNDIRGAGGSISATRIKRVLYEQKGYEPQYKGKGQSKRLTSDVAALLNLGKKHPQDPFLADLLLHSKLEGIKETLEWQPDPLDGRMKCAYNQFSRKSGEAEETGGGSTETGRLRCGKSIIPVGEDSVGGNLQTVTKKLRLLYCADPDHWLFQCDLAGADGWTVAAWCKHFGDSTMWDDYTAGIKPAKVVALMYMHGPQAVQCSREELREKCKAVDQDGWLYFACKRVQHATNYGVKPPTMQNQIMLDSYKIAGSPIYIGQDVCAALQRLYLIRYHGVYSWQNHCAQQVFNGHQLTSASGHTRTFFGRRKSYNPKKRQYEADHDTWKEWLADEPQENTSHANNLALTALWQDEENHFRSAPQELQRLAEAPLRVRLGDRATTRNLEDALIIEPLHTVHDANIGQWPKAVTDWAVPRMRGYYDNPLTIANQSVTIPFEGAYGPSWGELGEKYGGGTI